ncbi:MAG: alkaline phosphatase D family protein [Betaproteobacteria bacterium]|nr:alkaline phosphatase D family protein [Betaproteobacteria bacterium]
MPVRPFRSRRRFLQTTLASGASLALPAGALAQAPAVITSDRARPQVTSGLQIGDVTGDRALIWSRADRPSRLVVERAFREDFSDAVKVRGPLALDTSDYTARVDLTGLPADREVFVRVAFEDLSSERARSESVQGRFRTPPAGRRDVTFAWSGDTAGQGWGINKEWGGMKCYDTLRRDQPDFFIHCGDTIYADGPIPATVALPGDAVWRNVVTEEVSKVAETLKEFRGRYQYNLMDDNVRRMSAEIPQVWQWDDHEVMNNWSDSKDISADKRYTEKNVQLLVARATRAFLEYAPLRYHGADESERVYRKISYGPLLDVFVLDMRTYRGPNSYNRQEKRGPDTAFLGEQQLAWLKSGLKASKAAWKVVSADMPISLLVDDGKDAEGRDKFEAVANGDGPVLGREFEFADLFSFLKKNKVRNVVWITADVHYTAAHYYDPAKARFTDFSPFWEFVSGPIHAGGFGPNKLDDTFGPQLVFQKAPGGRANVSPVEGGQFYGLMKIDGKTGALRVQLKDIAGAVLFEKTLPRAA